jgi:hypothetical protein
MFLIFFDRRLIFLSLRESRLKRAVSEPEKKAEKINKITNTTIFNIII